MQRSLPVQSAPRVDLVTIVLAALGCAGGAVLFLLVQWRAALAADAALCLLVLTGVLLARRRQMAAGRWIAGAALGFTVLLILAEELALGAVGAGAFAAAVDHPFYVQLWGARGLSRIEQTLRQGDVDGRRWAADALRPYGSAAVPDWQAGLKDADAAVRQACAAGLSNFPDPSSETLLLASMRDPDLQVRVKARSGLAMLAGVGSCRAMAKTVGGEARRRRDPRAGFQAGRDPGAEGAAEMLRELVPRRYAMVAQCLTDPDPEVRLGMLAGMNPDGSTASIATSRAVRLLQQLPADPDPVVRAAATQALGAVTRAALRVRPGSASYGLDPAWLGDAASRTASVDADGVLNELADQLAASRPETASPALGALYLVLYDLPPAGSSPEVASPAPAVRPQTYARIFDAVWKTISSGCSDYQACNILDTLYKNRAGVLLFASKLNEGPKSWRLRAANFLYEIGDPAALPALRQADAHWVSSDEDYCPVCNTRHCAFCSAIHHLDPGAQIPHPIPPLGPKDEPHPIPTILKVANR